MPLERNKLYESIKKDPERRIWTPYRNHGATIDSDLKELTNLRLIDYFDDARSYLDKNDLFYASIKFSTLDDWLLHVKFTKQKKEEREKIETQLLASNLKTNESNIRTNRFNRRFTILNIVLTIFNLAFIFYQIFTVKE